MNPELQEDPEARASLEAAIAQQEPDTVKLTCPHCKVSVKIDPMKMTFDKRFGRSTVCPQCGKRFAVVRYVRRAG